MDSQQKKGTDNASQSRLSKDIKDRILNLSHDLICITGMDGYFKYLNPAWQETLGYTEEELLSRPFLDFIHPDDHKRNNDEIEKLAARDIAIDFENRYIHKEGSIRHISWRATPVPEEKLIYCIGRDITEHKLVEKALQVRVKERICIADISQLAEQSGITIQDFVQGAVSKLPSAWQYPEICCARLTFDSKTFKTANFRETNWSQSADIKVDGKKIGTVTVCYLKERPAADEGPFLKEERNLIITIAEFIGYVIQRKQSVDTLRMYYTMLDMATDSIIIHDLDGNIVYANQIAGRMRGYKKGEMIGKDIHELIAPEYDNELVGKKLLQIIEKDEYLFETGHLHKDGSIFLVEVHARLIEWEGAKYILRVSRDITDRKRAEEALEISFRNQLLAVDILQTLNRPNELKNLICDIMKIIKETLDFDAVAIRLREGDDFPYFVVNGFTEEFAAKEKHLCARDDAGKIIRNPDGNPVLECMCGNVLCGRTNPSLPFFTSDGSFWTNSTTELLTSTTEEDRQTRTRNRCYGEGYESVALIPLCINHEILGLLQLNDHQRDRFNLEMMQFLEGLGSSIGIALKRNLSDEQIRQSEESLNKAQKVAHVGSWVWHIQSNHLEWSDEMFRIFGIEKEGFQGDLTDVIARAIHPEDRAAVEKSNLSVIKNKKPIPLEYRVVWPDGTVRVVWAEAGELIGDDSGNPAVLTGIVKDITERKQSEEQIQKNLWEKEILLRELYHRTKNNMQVISSMLRLRARSAKEQQISDAFKEMENKILSMALVHQKLYESSDLSHLNLKDYIKSLIKLLERSLLTSSKQIDISIKGDDINVLLDTAIPFGLIIDELVTNAIKYAFPDNRKGRIDLGLHINLKKEIVFEISDNGVGLPKNFDFKTDGGIGLQIITDLVEYQLEGRITFKSRNGLHYRIVIKEGLYESRV